MPMAETNTELTDSDHFLINEIRILNRSIASEEISEETRLTSSKSPRTM